MLWSFPYHGCVGIFSWVRTAWILNREKKGWGFRTGMSNDLELLTDHSGNEVEAKKSMQPNISYETRVKDHTSRFTWNSELPHVDLLSFRWPSLCRFPDPSQKAVEVFCHETGLAVLRILALTRNTYKNPEKATKLAMHSSDFWLNDFD